MQIEWNKVFQSRVDFANSPRHLIREICPRRALPELQTILQGFDKRQVGYVASVGVTPALDELDSFLVESSAEFVVEPALPHPRLANNGHQLSLATEHMIQTSGERLELLVTTRKGTEPHKFCRLQPGLKACGSQHSIRDHGLTSIAQHQRRHCLRLEKRCDDALTLRTHEDFVSFGPRKQLAHHLHRGSHDLELRFPRVRRLDHQGTGVQHRENRERLTTGTLLQLSAQLGNRGSPIHGRTHASECVVLVRGRHAEQGFHFVTHESVDHTAVLVHDLFSSATRNTHRALEVLWIQFFDHCRIPGQPGKEDRGVPALALGQRPRLCFLRGDSRDWRCRRVKRSARFLR